MPGTLPAPSAEGDTGLFPPQNLGDWSVFTHYLYSVFLQLASPVSGRRVFLACGQIILERQMRPELTPLWSILLFYFVSCDCGGLFAFWDLLWVIQHCRCWVVLCSDLVGAGAWQVHRTPPAILLWVLCAVACPAGWSGEKSSASSFRTSIFSPPRIEDFHLISDFFPQQRLSFWELNWQLTVNSSRLRVSICHQPWQYSLYLDLIGFVL